MLSLILAFLLASYKTLSLPQYFSPCINLLTCPGGGTVGNSRQSQILLFYTNILFLHTAHHFGKAPRLLSSIPWFGYSTGHLTIHPLTDTWVVSGVGLS